MDDEPRIRWFAREILPHEGAVRHWLQRKVRSSDADEIIQEVYARIWASADAGRVENPRAYFFVAVRRLMAEIIRRSQIVSIRTVANIEALQAVDEITPEMSLSGRQELDHFKRILGRLPPKCREAFLLKKVDELSQRDIARRMGISESTVEKHLAKALRILTDEMRTVRVVEPIGRSRTDAARQQR